MDFSNWLEGWKSYFRDPEWLRKTGTYVLYSLIPILGIFVMNGFVYERVHMVLRGNTDELPEMKGNFERYLNRGAKMFGFSFLVGIVSSLLSLTGIGGIFSMVLSFAMYVPIAHFLVSGEKFGNFFEFKEQWARLQNNFNAYFKLLLISMGYGLVTVVVVLPLTLALEFSMIPVIANMDSHSFAVVFILMFVFFMFFVLLLPVSIVISMSANYYLAEYIRAAYPDRFQPQAPTALENSGDSPQV